jgi:RNA polymerase sigma-70 factor, ECF subfamily
MKDPISHRLAQLEQDPPASWTEADRRFILDANRAYLELFAKRRLVTRGLCDDDAVQDIVQGVLVRAFRTLDQFDRSRGASLRTWLGIMLKYAVADHISRASCHPVESLEYKPEGLGCEPPKPAADPAARAERSDFEAQVLDCLSQLPAHQRRAFELHVFRELSYEDAAAALGLSLSAFKTCLYRARQNLRRMLISKGYHDE